MNSRLFASAIVIVGLVVAFVAIAMLSVVSALLFLAGVSLIVVGALFVEVSP